MNNINEPKKRGRPKKPKPKRGRPKGSCKIITEEQKRIRKNKNLKYARNYYRRKISANPLRIRAYTTNERKRKTLQGQALLQAKSGADKAESEEQIQGKNEE